MKMNGMRVAVLGGLAMVCCGGSLQAQSSGSFSDQDKTFLKNSAEGSMAEISMSQIALKKSKNDDVKSYAQKMVDDHNKLISDMKPFADQAGVVPPTKLNAKHLQEEARLRSMTGDKFDHEYITAMVGSHHKDLGEFQAEEASTQNQDLKSAVASGEQVVKQHTQMIDQMAQQKGITTPPMPSAM